MAGVDVRGRKIKKVPLWQDFFNILKEKD